MTRRRGVYVFPGESKGNEEEQEIARSSEEMIAMYEELVQAVPDRFYRGRIVRR